MKRSRKGFSLLTVLIAFVLVITGSWYFARSSERSKKSVEELNEIIISEYFAIELLELLRSHKPAQLRAQFRKNPMFPADKSKNPYKLCSHVNLLKRKDAAKGSGEGLNIPNGTLINEDPMAHLPPNTLDGPTAETKTNRYYQIAVANIKGTSKDDLIKISDRFCKINMKDVYLQSEKTPGGTGWEQLTSDERFIVTVGVSWIPKGKGVENVKQVVLSTILPDAE